jgi:hypothetical protein
MPDVTVTARDGHYRAAGPSLQHEVTIDAGIDGALDALEIALEVLAQPGKAPTGKERVVFGDPLVGKPGRYFILARGDDSYTVKPFTIEGLEQ